MGTYAYGIGAGSSWTLGGRVLLYAWSMRRLAGPPGRPAGAILAESHSGANPAPALVEETQMVPRTLSLAEVDTAYRNGRYSRAEVVDYIREWNRDAYTQAVLADDAIRNFDPRTGRYRELWAEFEVRG